jgi:hemoglobin-like flavoprotein
MSISKKAKAVLSEISHSKSLTLSESVMYLHSIYNLDAIEEFIAQVKEKHLSSGLTPAHKAALKILATYIDVIS